MKNQKPKKQEDPPQRRKPDHVLMIVQAGVLWYLLCQFMFGADLNLVDRYKHMKKEEEYALDMGHSMPARAPYPTSPSNPWWYLTGTDTSMEGFEQFLKTNYSAKPVTLTDKVDRSTLRKMLYEYLLSVISFSLHSEADMEDDKLKFFLVGKTAKDYLMYTGQTEFPVNQIAEILDSKALVCFMNYMANDMMSEVEAFEHTNFCQRTGCTQDLVERNYFPRWKVEHVMWGIYKYFETYDASHLFETFTTFDDWSQFLPIVNLELSNISLDFFSLPPGPARNLSASALRPKYPQDLKDVAVRHRSNSPFDMLDEKLRRPKWLPNTSMALHIAVRSLKNQTEYLGHNKYKYRKQSSGEQNTLYWVRFPQPYGLSVERGQPQGGLPWCVYSRISVPMFLEEKEYACPGLAVDPHGLKGMSN